MKNSILPANKNHSLSEEIFELKEQDLPNFSELLLIKKPTLFNLLAQGWWVGTFNFGNDNTLDGSFTQHISRKNKKSVITRIISLPAYYWILISQLFVVMPLLSYLPLWLICFTVFSIIMQVPKIKYTVRCWQQNRKKKKERKRNNDNVISINHQKNTDIKEDIENRCENHRQLLPFYRPIQLMAFVVGVGSLWVSYGGFHVESGIAFLLLCLASKLWELYQKRDALVLLNLSLFMTAAVFLLDKGFISSLQVLLSVFAVLMAFIAMNDDVDDIPSADNSSLKNGDNSHQNLTTMHVDGSGRVRSLLLLTSLAIPLLIVLFLFFPRLPPLWSLQLSSSMSKTGVSDSMSPGDFAQLSKSSELAFRVEFSDRLPYFSDMYWRGLVFSDFDGKTWQQNKRNMSIWQYEQSTPEWFNVKGINDDSADNNRADNTQPEIKQKVIVAQSTKPLPEVFQYTIILEPTNNDWLYGLEYPFENQATINLTSNYTLLKSLPITEKISYQTYYKPNIIIDDELSTKQKRINLALPSSGNEESHKLAKELFNQSSSVDDYIDKITSWINKSEFYYTLSPPALGKNRIDDFLFNTKSGFCEHYSSSFVFLMRAAGVPARVVVGYHGGMIGRDGSSWEVRQMDAHAWTEVWIEKKGWTRVDPTAFVAPERIENGMSAMAEQSGVSFFGSGIAAQLSYQQFKIIKDMRRFSDQMSYFWQKNIVGYDQDSQSNKLSKWFNIKSIYKQVMVMIVIAITIFSIIIFWLWFRQRQIWHPADKSLVKLAKKIAKIYPELVQKESDGHLAWLQRVEAHAQFSQYATELKQIKNSYRTLRYGRLSQTNNERGAEYKQLLHQHNQLIRLLKKQMMK